MTDIRGVFHFYLHPLSLVFEQYIRSFRLIVVICNS